MAIAFEDTVIARTGHTAENLSLAFELVENHKDWKGPIDAKIPTRLRGVVAAAIEFYTATVPEFFGTPDPDTLHVKAAGYRAGPARQGIINERG